MADFTLGDGFAFEDEMDEVAAAPEGSPLAVQQGGKSPTIGGARLSSAQKKQVRKDQINLGEDRQFLGKSARTKMQGKIVEQGTLLKRLDDLIVGFDADFMRASGRVQRKIYEGLDYVGIASDAQQDRIQAANNFLVGAEQLFLDAKKEATGAQASVQEIAMLRKAILNNMVSPAKFLQMFEVTRRRLSMSLTEMKESITKGVDTSRVPESPLAGVGTMRRILEGDDPPETLGYADKVSERIEALNAIKNGADPDLVKKMYKGNTGDDL